MVSCPICGSSNFNIGKCCKRYEKTVCIECCKDCECYSYDEIYFMHRCKYGVAETEKVKDEISETRKKIKELDKRQAELYQKGYWRKAEDAVWEIVELQRKLKGLEEPKGA